MTGPFPLPPPPSFVVGERLACDSARGRKLEVVVGRLDHVGAGVTVAGVSVHDLSPGATIPVAAHAPYLEATLAASCRTPIALGVAPAPEFAQGYALWRKAFEAGTGGYFTVSVDASLDVMAGMLPQAPAARAATPAPLPRGSR